MTKMKKQIKRIRRTQNFSLLVVTMTLIIVALFLIPHAQAQTITMSNPGGIAERDIIVYYPNGTMQGFYNSTSVITLDSNTSYIFAMKPVRTNPLEDPGDWMVSAFSFIQSNLTALLAGVLLIGLFGAALSRR